MKNFDFPYINDSPVDLSGREGAERKELYVCSECGNEVESEGLTVDQAMACPEHPKAIIDGPLCGKEPKQ